MEGGEGKNAGEKNKVMKTIERMEEPEKCSFMSFYCLYEDNTSFMVDVW